MIKDLLWACLVCGAEESLRQVARASGRRRVETCENCGAEYWRGSGANIVVQERGRAPVERAAGEWVELLPAVRPYGSARAELRIAFEDKPFRALGVYMGRYERMGPPRTGQLELNAERLRFAADDGEALEWPLMELSAIQMSSSTLQLKPRRRPLLAIRFQHSSARLWEERLQAAVRAAYARAGKREIVEFQPRICTK